MLFTALKSYRLFQIFQNASVLNKAHKFPLEANKGEFLLILLLLFHMASFTENTITALLFSEMGHLSEKAVLSYALLHWEENMLKEHAILKVF